MPASYELVSLWSATLVVPSHPECLYKELETRTFIYFVDGFPCVGGKPGVSNVAFVFAFTKAIHDFKLYSSSQRLRSA